MSIMYRKPNALWRYPEIVHKPWSMVSIPFMNLMAPSDHAIRKPLMP